MRYEALPVVNVMKSLSINAMYLCSMDAIWTISSRTKGRLFHLFVRVRDKFFTFAVDAWDISEEAKRYERTGRTIVSFGREPRPVLHRRRHVSPVSSTTAAKVNVQYSVRKSWAMTNLLRWLRVNSSSLFISEEALPLASRITANPLQFASPLLLRWLRLSFVSAANLRLNTSLLLRFLLLLLVAVHLDVFCPLQSRLSCLPALHGEDLRLLSSSFRFFHLEVEMVNYTFTVRRVRVQTSRASCLSLSSCLSFFA